MYMTNIYRWIESWKKMARQLLCSNLEFSSTESTHACMKTEDDLRETFCVQGKTLLQTMKTELECAYSISCKIFRPKIEYFSFILLLLIGEKKYFFS